MLASVLPCLTCAKLRILFDPLLVFSIVSGPILVLMAFLEILPNLCADLALLYRMLAVYPASLTSRKNFLAVVGPAIAMKVLRLATITVVLVYSQKNGVDAMSAHFSLPERQWAIVDQCIAALDNVYARSDRQGPVPALNYFTRYMTAFFLWKLKPVVHPPGELGRYSMGEHGAYAPARPPQKLSVCAGSIGSRIRRLFWSSVTCFVIPGKRSRMTRERAYADTPHSATVHHTVCRRGRGQQCDHVRILPRHRQLHERDLRRLRY
jgi:hypothetical protein